MNRRTMFGGTSLEGPERKGCTGPSHIAIGPASFRLASYLDFGQFPGGGEQVTKRV
jgi:hypothetical protein